MMRDGRKKFSCFVQNDCLHLLRFFLKEVGVKNFPKCKLWDSTIVLSSAEIKNGIIIPPLPHTSSQYGV